MNEPIETLSGEELSGAEVIQDVLWHLEAALLKSALLRPTDAYASYSGKIRLELQLADIDVHRLDENFTIGSPDPARPSHPFEVEIPAAPTCEVRDRSGLPSPASLERFVDGREPTPAKRKFYAPRMPHAKQ